MGGNESKYQGKGLCERKVENSDFSVDIKDVLLNTDTTAFSASLNNSAEVPDKADVKDNLPQAQAEPEATNSLSNFSTTFNQIPPEIWDQIFGNLPNFIDCVNASNAVPYWKQVLHSSRSTWMFGLVFTSFMEYLSKEDILHCRLVCKQWSFAIDYCLENNCFQRPATAHVPKSAGKPNFPLDSIPSPSIRTLEKLRLDYNNFWVPEKIERFLFEADTHPRCPFAGKSVMILEFHGAAFRNLNEPFLRSFGHYIYFLKIMIGHFQPVETLTRILNLIAHVPNLKKLDISGKIAYMPDESKTVIESRLSECMENRISLSNSNIFPNLDTLDITLIGHCHKKVTELLMNYLANRNIQSVRLHKLPTALKCSSWELENVTRFQMAIGSSAQLNHLFQFHSPVKALILKLRGRVKISLVFQFVYLFEATLCHLELGFLEEFFTAQVLPCINLPIQVLEMMNPSVFDGLKNLISVTISSSRPISFNFLCGLQNRLEYLNIFIDMRHCEQFLNEAFPVQEWRERLDLLEMLKKWSTEGKQKIYESNVWQLFPRLKALKIFVGHIKSDEKPLREYWRSIYENLEYKRNQEIY